MTSVTPILCLACTRYRGGSLCTSFPSGIPDGIIHWGADHRESIGGEPPFELDESRTAVFEQWLEYGPFAERETDDDD